MATIFCFFPTVVNTELDGGISQFYSILKYFVLKFDLLKTIAFQDIKFTSKDRKLSLLMVHLLT